MKNTIKAYTGYNEYHNTRYYTEFEIISNSKLEDLKEELNGKVQEVSLDGRNNDEVYDYDFYELEYEEEGESYTNYYAILKD